MPTIDNEYSTPKITPADGVKIPSVGENSGYQLDEELREYIQNGVTGVTEQYSTLMTYAYGKRLKHEGVEYRCIVPVESPEIFDPDKWVKVDLTELDKRVLDNADAINAIIRTFDTDISMLAGTHGEYSVPAEDIPISAKILGLAYRNYPSSEIMDVTWNFIKVTGHWIVSYNNPFGARTVSVSIYYAL